MVYRCGFCSVHGANTVGSNITIQPHDLEHWNKLHIVRLDSLAYDGGNIHVATPELVCVPGVVHLLTVGLLQELTVHGLVPGQVHPLLVVPLVMLSHPTVLHTAVGGPLKATQSALVLLIIRQHLEAVGSGLLEVLFEARWHVFHLLLELLDVLTNVGILHGEKS